MLERNRFAIHKRQEGRGFDIYDPDTGVVVGTAVERVGFLTKSLRWMLPKRWRPTFVEVREKPDDSLVFMLQRGWPPFGSSIEVCDAHQQLVGTISGRFRIHDKAENRFANVKGRVFGFNFPFVAEDGASELGRVSKNPDGCTLETATSLTELPLSKMLLLAATLAITLSA